MSFWLLAAVAIAGAGLACFYLTERRIGGAARLVSWAHAAAGAAGVALAWFAIARGASGPAGFAQIAGWMLAATLALGMPVLIAQLRRRRPSGLVVAIHASLGVGGLVVLAAVAF